MDVLEEGEKVFVNARVGGALVDFSESGVTHETRFDGNSYVTGRIDELPIANDHRISMMWETGLSEVLEHTASVCNYDMSSCGHARTVPVIDDVDQK